MIDVFMDVRDGTGPIRWNETGRHATANSVTSLFALAGGKNLFPGAVHYLCLTYVFRAI